MSDYGSLQILIKQSDQYATGAGGAGYGQTVPYKTDLAGNYRLTLKGLQVHVYPEITTANTIPIEIYSPNFLYPHGDVYYPTVLYPFDANNKYQGSFDMSYMTSLQSDLRIQIRNALTHLPLDDLVYAVLNFEYEKI